jgi:hypothetical protein
MKQISLRRCLWAPLVVVLFACDPQVPFPHRVASDSASAEEGGAIVAVEPSAPFDAVPAVLRLHVAAAGISIDPEAVALIQGHVGPAHLRAIQRREISAALAKRIVPALTYLEVSPGNTGQPPSVVVAPTVVLTPGERYALVIGEPPEIAELEVAARDTAPLLERIWPPLESSATAGFGVWCGNEELAEMDEPIQLAPAGQRGRIRRGVVKADRGQRCVRFESAPDEVAEGGVPPPVLPGSKAVRRLDPRPLVADADPQLIAPLACAVDELAFGPGCARVFDDRLAGRSPESPALWSIQGDGIDRVFATAAGEPFVIAPLPPEAVVSLHLAAIDNRGQGAGGIFSAMTLPPMPHVVLNEVFANPIGPEPAQEWVEIVNDGAVPAELGGYVLVDVGGETPLPSVTLAPGGFALIVNEAFVEDNDYDPKPASSAQILRVPELGHAGLSNAGEPLTLRDAGGVAVSRFPSGPSSKAGMSVARRYPGAPDALLQAFTVAKPTPGRTNEP